VKARDDRNELDRLREDGRRRREEKDKVSQGVVDLDEQVRREKVKEGKRKVEVERTAGAVELGPLDMALKVKWLRLRHPSLVSSAILSTFLATHLGINDPEIESIVISPKFLINTGKGKHGSGLVAFKTLSAAVRLMESVSKGNGVGIWEGIEVNWASGSPPAVLLASQPPINKSSASSFPSVVSPSFVLSSRQPFNFTDAFSIHRCWSIQTNLVYSSAFVQRSVLR
jgi:hypothetical protein